MNDEIKEILDKLKNCKDYDDEVFLIKQHSATLLLDYITNLQKTNKNHSKKLIELGDKITNLQQENETLHENNQDMQEEMARVWEENERLKETNVYCNRTDCVGRIKDSRKYDSVYQEKEDYKSRCEKAIEYINNGEILNTWGYYKPFKEFGYGKDLLNILESKNE